MTSVAVSVTDGFHRHDEFGLPPVRPTSDTPSSNVLEAPLPAESVDVDAHARVRRQGVHGLQRRVDRREQAEHGDQRDRRPDDLEAVVAVGLRRERRSGSSGRPGRSDSRARPPHPLARLVGPAATASVAKDRPCRDAPDDRRDDHSTREEQPVKVVDLRPSVPTDWGKQPPSVVAATRAAADTATRRRARSASSLVGLLEPTGRRPREPHARRLLHVRSGESGKDEAPPLPRDQEDHDPGENGDTRIATWKDRVRPSTGTFRSTAMTSLPPASVATRKSATNAAPVAVR